MEVWDTIVCYAGQRGHVPRLACAQDQQRRETTNSNEFGTETQSQHNFPNFFIFIDELNTQDNRGLLLIYTQDNEH